MSDSNEVDEVGLRLAAFRKRLGISQRELGRRAGLSGRYIGGIESGERQGTRETLAKISDALGRSLSELVGDGDVGIPCKGTVDAAGIVHSSESERRIRIPAGSPDRYAVEVDEGIGTFDAGDWLAIERSISPAPDDVVVVAAGDSQCLRKLKVIEGERWLWPLGSEGAPDRYVAPLSVAGVVVGLWREFRK
jgi:transcriptional regulator with XRE-family HTH domain